MSKHRYYFKKPKGEIVKDILLWLAAGGAVAIAATSPYFGLHLVQAFLKNKKHKPKSTENAFRRLYREGYIAIEKSNRQLFISLTDEGRKRAGIYQINNLAIRKPKRWDGKWRVVIFDISDRQRMKREALRGFLKRLQFYKLQDSVWAHPFNCEDEVTLLREFFGFTIKEFQLIVAEKVENQSILRDVFKV